MDLSIRKKEKNYSTNLRKKSVVISYKFNIDIKITKLVENVNNILPLE